MKDLEHTISNAERDLNNMLTLKEATEDSITYTRALLDLDMNRRSLKTYEDQYEKAKEHLESHTFKATSIEEMTDILNHFGQKKALNY